jgi:predicted nucleic acid-binding protein
MKNIKKSVYLDVCCLSRAYDDQRYLRIRMETEAISIILEKIKEGHLELVFSPVHIKEIEAIPEISERVELMTLLQTIGTRISADTKKTRKIAEDLILKGFGIADAAHVAFAVQYGASFITCDDKLLKKCGKNKINTWCGNPIQFCEKENLK